MAKTINTILFNDKIESTKLVSMDNCVCQLYDISRDDTDFQQHATILKCPALYILLNRKLKKAYIGETDDFSRRIMQHLTRKYFWMEVLVFTANNNSLTKTEVLYLEALSYKVAANAGSYDLSENTQLPSEPNMTPVVKIKTEAFFKDVQFLTKFIGCDIFEYHETQSDITIVKPIITPLPVDTTPDELEGRCKLSLNGEGKYSKRRFVHSVIKKVIETFPNISFAELKATFYRDLLGYWSRWELLQDNIEYARALPQTEGKPRYLTKDDDILKSGDNVRFVVCTEWDAKNLPSILGIVRALGWQYEIIGG